MRSTTYYGLIMLAIAQPGQAKESASAVDLKRLEARVPSQSWYPEGYYDARIAAEGELAEALDRNNVLVEDWGDGLGKRYDILGCGGYFITPTEVDKATMRYGDVALNISRMRAELAQLGYPATVYAEPLAGYERHLIEQATARSEAEVRMAVGLGSDEDVAFDLDPPPDENEPPSFDAPLDTGNSPEYELGAAIEANRKRLAPKLPMVVADGGCGDAAPAPVIIRTVPPGGTVMLISAFAFKVCTRKLPDPWDRFACRWNEVETGTPTGIRGRNVYQIRWPDGTERRGTREFELNYDDDQPTTATFRKTGS